MRTTSSALIAHFFIFPAHTFHTISPLEGRRLGILWHEHIPLYLSNQNPCHRLPCSTQLALALNEDEIAEEKIVIRGDGSDDIPDEIWESVEASQPSQWMVMKELFGINIFTYILAAAIVFFMSMNFVLGPGWLGNVVGIEGTGNYADVSDSLPDVIDLSDPKYQL